MTINKNNNRAVVRRLARRSVRSNGRASLLTALSIALTAMLVTVLVLQVTGMVNSQKKTLERAQQVIYMNLSEDQMKSIQTDKRVSSTIVNKMGQGVEENGVVVRPTYYEPSTWDMESLRLSEGRMAETLTEVATDKATLRAFGLPETLGTQITVHFLNSEPETFTVVGLTDYETATDKLPLHNLYLSLSYAESGPQLAEKPWSLLARVKDGADMNGPSLESLVYQLGEDYGVIHQNVNPNDLYIDLRTTKVTNVLTYMGVALTLAAVSLLVIYSIFYLSVAARVRQFGQLRTIGMTPKQLRRMVKQEGWLLWAMGTPAGFALASLSMLIFGPENGWELQNNLVALSVSAAACAIAVRLGVQKPASIAAAATPIEAARFQSWKGKSERINATPQALTPWNLARLNFARNWKKQILTMLSLAIGGILFMATVIYVDGWQLESFSRQAEWKSSEYVVSFDYNAENSLENGVSALQLQGLMGPAFQSAVLQQPDVEDITVYQGVTTRFHWDGVEGDDYLTPVTRNDTAILEKYLQEGTSDYDTLVQSGGVFLNSSGLFEELFGKTPQLGDEIECTYFNGQTRTVRLTVMGIARNGVRDELTDSSFLLIPYETAKALFGDMDTIRKLTVSMKDDSHTPAQDEEMRTFMADYPQLQLSTLTDHMEMDASGYAVMKAMFIAFSGFVVLFSLVNLLNTLLSSLMTRRLQLSMLSALGMTRRQTGRMLDFENLLLSGVNLIATLSLGTLAGWGLCRLMAVIGVNYITFSFPLLWFLLYAAVAVGTPVLITRICLRSFYKESLTERLRASE